MTLNQSKKTVLKSLVKSSIRERTKRAKDLASAWKLACRVIEGSQGPVFFYDFRQGRIG